MNIYQVKTAGKTSVGDIHSLLGGIGERAAMLEKSVYITAVASTFEDALEAVAQQFPEVTVLGIEQVKGQVAVGK